MSPLADRDLSHDVAIIGMDARLPGAAHLDRFWDNLRNGTESIRFFSDEELAASGVEERTRRDPSYVPAKGVLEGADCFDAALFGYSPFEAALIDPQQRMFLECSWAAFEDAGYDPSRYDGLVGVYAGARMSTYVFNLYDRPDVVGSVEELPVLLGNDKDYLTTRVSYLLDLRGPSIVTQSACSSALAAVHLACQGLLDHHCDLALAGGVRVSTPLYAGYRYDRDGILSPDGHCRTFDARARGTVFSDGAGAVVLKRFDEAIQDRDLIRAVIRGSALNNDGGAKMTWTGPAVAGQADVIATAMAMASVQPEEIDYVETHGTGTRLGDPVEVAALTLAYGDGSERPRTCRLGSVKPNVGHLSAAAGMASLLKVVLALEHREIPPSINYARPNPEVDFNTGGFVVNDSLVPWDGNDGPRLAGVSSFGMGGTNVHLVVEEAPI